MEIGVCPLLSYPYAPTETYIHGPSVPDISFTRTYGNPGYVIDKESIMRIDPQTGNITEVSRR